MPNTPERLTSNSDLDLEQPEHDSEAQPLLSLASSSSDSSTSSALLPTAAVRAIGLPAFVSYPAHLILFVLSPLVMMPALEAIAKETFGIQSELAVKALTIYFTETASEVEFARFFQAVQTEVMLAIERQQYGDPGSKLYQLAYAFVHTNAHAHAWVKSVLLSMRGTQEDLVREVQAVLPVGTLERIATGFGVARSYGLQLFFVLPAAYALMDGLAGYFYHHTTPTIRTTDLQILLATVVMVMGIMSEIGRVTTAVARNVPAGIFNAYMSGLNDPFGHLRSFLSPLLPLRSEHSTAQRLNIRAAIASVMGYVPGQLWQLLAANLPMLILPIGLYEGYINPTPSAFAQLVIGIIGLALLFVRLFNTISHHIVAPSRRAWIAEDQGTVLGSFGIGVGFPSQVFSSLYSPAPRALPQITHMSINDNDPERSLVSTVPSDFLSQLPVTAQSSSDTSSESDEHSDDSGLTA